MNEKGSFAIVFFVGCLIISGVILGGSVFYKSGKSQVSIKSENIKNKEKTISQTNDQKKQLISGGDQFSSASVSGIPKLKNSSFSFTDFSDYLDFNSNCFEFKYPKAFKVDREDFVKDHKPYGDFEDSFGQGSITLVNNAEKVIVSCFPSVVTAEEMFVYAQKGYRVNGHHPSDFLEKTRIADLDGYKESHNAYSIHEAGTLDVRGYGENYSIAMMVIIPGANFSDLSDLKILEINKMISSIKIKNIFINYKRRT